jgi:hypothetical protein
MRGSQACLLREGIQLPENADELTSIVLQHPHQEAGRIREHRQNLIRSQLWSVGWVEKRVTSTVVGHIAVDLSASHQ